MFWERVLPADSVDVGEEAWRMEVLLTILWSLISLTCLYFLAMANLGFIALFVAVSALEVVHAVVVGVVVPRIAYAMAVSGLQRSRHRGSPIAE